MEAESWWFDFATADGDLGGFVRLVLLPAQGACWYWAALVGEDRPYMLVRDDDVPPPRSGATEVRAEGLWSALECEEPFDHWTVGLEAFAVALDDPEDAWAGERGDVAGLGFDLEWEAQSVPGPMTEAGHGAENGGGYGQACTVHGAILVGPSERIDFTGAGWRSHTWGPLTEPVPPATGADARGVRHRAPLLAGGRRAEYVLCRATSGAGWRARDPGS